MIPGETIIWCKQRTPNSYWSKMPYAPRSYSENEALIDYYQGEWGNLYSYKITANLDICRPLA